MRVAFYSQVLRAWEHPTALLKTPIQLLPSRVRHVGLRPAPLLSLFLVASSSAQSNRLPQALTKVPSSRQLFRITRHVHHISRGHMCIKERAGRLLQRLGELGVVDVAVVVLVVVLQDAIYDADELILAHGWGLLTPLLPRDTSQ